MLRIRRWLRAEAGLSEAATAIIVLPLIAALMFLLVETGFNIKTRTTIDSVLQDTTRGAALEGGNHNARSSSLPTSMYPNGWSSYGTQRLRAACAAGAIRLQGNCNSIGITCSPGATTRVGDVVTCSLTVPVTYKTLSPLSTNPAFSFGMSGLFTTPIKSTLSSRSAVGLAG